MSDTKEEPTVKSESAYSGTLFSVRKDTVHLSNGRTTDREIVVHPEAVAVIPVLTDGRLVLVRQYRKPAERMLLELPAGGVEPGEDPEQAVKRELLEETGYRVGSTRKLASFYTSPGYSTELMHLFLAHDLQEGEPTEKTDQIELELINVDELMSRVHEGQIQDAKTILGVLMYHSQMRFSPASLQMQERSCLGDKGSAGVQKAEVRRARELEKAGHGLEQAHAAEVQVQGADASLRFLSEASTILSSSLDYELTLRRVAELVVPQVADWCAVHIVSEDGSVQQLATAHADSAKVQLAGELERRFPFDPGAETGAAQVIRTGKAELISEITDEFIEAAVPDPELITIIRDLGLRSLLVVPLQARGRILGSITLVGAESGRRFTARDLAMAEDLGRRAGLAIDNARLHREALRVAAEQAAVLAQMAECVSMVDASGRVVYLNEAARQMTGSSQLGEQVGTYVEQYFVRTLEGQPLRPDEVPLARAVRGETVIEEKWRVKAEDGKEVIMQGSAAPVVTEDGVRIGAVCTYRDVTEQVSLEHQKDEFLSSAAHDLKTPLTTIKGLAQMLSRRASRSDSLDLVQLREGLDAIDNTTSRMNGLINELLDVTRIHMGRPIDLNRREVDLMRVVTEVVGELREISVGRRISLHRDTDELYGDWDRRRLERVLTNLVSNALKYSPKGGEVKVMVQRESDSEGTWAVLTVQDQGVGIPVIDQPHIFERFYRGKNVQNDIPGTGIGLAGALHIVEQHGGSIEVKSQEGQGSTFIVRLPINATQVETVSEDEVLANG